MFFFYRKSVGFVFVTYCFSFFVSFIQYAYREKIKCPINFHAINHVTLMTKCHFATNVGKSHPGYCCSQLVETSVALIPKICFDIDIDIDILIFKNFDIDIDNIKLINLTLILISIFIFDILISYKILL